MVTAMKALDRKLLRDLRLMWSQVLTIALVVASGIGGFLITLSAVDSLALARDRFYATGQFADVFASVKRAPESLAQTLRTLPGVADVQTSTEMVVRVQIDGDPDPIIGQLIGVDARVPRRMNLITVRGRTAGDEVLSPGRARSDGALPVWISETFVMAHGLKPGDRLSALINGKYRALVMTGVALSPEYIFAALGGLPDQRGFGVFWLDREALAAAYDMDGAFNRVAVKLAPGASERSVIDALQHQLARYGGREAFGRDQQTSHMMLNDEIKGQHVLGTVLPSIFLGVAAFLLNVVVSRLVATQREQIAALKALGYPNLTIAAHYLKMVLVIVAIGFALGLTLGHVVGGMLTDLYAEFFRFPEFSHRMAPWLVVTSLLLTVTTAVVGTLNAIGATVRLAPAEAMRPPAPGHYRRTLLERLGITRIPTAARMILRNMERRPWRSALVDRWCGCCGGDRDHGQLLSRRHRLHRRDPVHPGHAQRRLGLDPGGRACHGAPGTAAPARRAQGRGQPQRAGDAGQRPSARAQPDPGPRRSSAAQPHHRPEPARPPHQRRRPGADRPAGAQTRRARGRQPAGRRARGPHPHAASGGRGHRQRDDGPERLHAPQRAEPGTGRRRPGQRLRAVAGARSRRCGAGRHAPACRWSPVPSARPPPCATCRRSARATSAS